MYFIPTTDVTYISIATAKQVRDLIESASALLLAHTSTAIDVTLGPSDAIVTATAALTVTLPLASNYEGQTYKIHADVDNVVVDDIEGTNFTLMAGETIDVYSDGTEWKV